MKKFLLILVLAFLFLLNFKLFTFSHGFSVFASENNHVGSNIQTLLNIEKIEYYENPLAVNEDTPKYITIVFTKNGAFLYALNGQEITALSVAGFLATAISPQMVNVFPWYAFLIGFVVILIIPFKK